MKTILWKIMFSTLVWLSTLAGLYAATVSYSYDALGQLTQQTSIGNMTNTTISYSYDPVGNWTANQVTVAVDSVGDGIPDSWRAQYFGGSGTTTNNHSCATCDADGTGQNNLFKYVTGLNPTNPASVFVFQIGAVTGQPSQMTLSYNPVAAGRTYTPQFCTSLNGELWETLFTASGPVIQGGQATVTDTNATTAVKFYRMGISYP
jgi:hypothetical protein